MYFLSAGGTRLVSRNLSNARLPNVAAFLSKDFSTFSCSNYSFSSSTSSSSSSSLFPLSSSTCCLSSFLFHPRLQHFRCDKLRRYYQQKAAEELAYANEYGDKKDEKHQNAQFLNTTHIQTDDCSTNAADYNHPLPTAEDNVSLQNHTPSHTEYVHPHDSRVNDYNLSANSNAHPSLSNSTPPPPPSFQNNVHFSHGDYHHQAAAYSGSSFQDDQMYQNQSLPHRQIPPTLQTDGQPAVPPPPYMHSYPPPSSPHFSPASFSSSPPPQYEDPYKNAGDPYATRAPSPHSTYSPRGNTNMPQYPPAGFIGDIHNSGPPENRFNNGGGRGEDIFAHRQGGRGGGGGMYNSNNDRYGSIGANLQNIEWTNEVMMDIKKDFYIEHPNVANRTEEEIRDILKQHDISIQGNPPIPKPVTTFEEACFPDYIYNEIMNAKYDKPSSIQSVGWPIGLKGRDMIGIAQTGSGKTLAFLLPAMLHINSQPPLRPGDGPIVLVLAPTRELAVQIQKEAIRFGKSSKIRNTCVYGGVSRYGQANDLRNGKEIVIATPGRLLDFLESGVTNLKRVTYLVLDEADRMLDMGFEHQIRKICSQIRPDRQTLLYSATWPKDVQILAKEFCKESPVKIQVGKSELQANPNIKQMVEIVPQIDLKTKFFEWMRNFANKGEKILIFCETKRGCDQLCRELRYQQYAALAIHGDKEQRERDRILSDFKTGRCNILIATDVASRGLDIKNIAYVVNYDLPKTIEDYVHRIGRTARGGNSGTSVTFFSYDYYTPEKARMARDIAHVMNDVGQTPPQDILELAKSAPHSSSNNQRRYSNYSGGEGGGGGGRGGGGGGGPRW